MDDATTSRIFTAWPCLASCNSPKADRARALIGAIALAVVENRPPPKLSFDEIMRGCCRHAVGGLTFYPQFFGPTPSDPPRKGLWSDKRR